MGKKELKGVLSVRGGKTTLSGTLYILQYYLLGHCVTWWKDHYFEGKIR